MHDDLKGRAESWFATLRDRICAEFEAIEDEAGTGGRFRREAWERPGGGGGTMAVMKGGVFEKVGVNISTVHGAFEPEFARTIHGAAEDPRFFATGISLVAHPANPHVPAVHMNTRLLVTTKQWFGGAADLNPALPIDDDTRAFRAALEAMCDRHSPDHWPKFSKWCDDYFWVPHRGRHRGVGGIFYDHLDGDPEADFAFTRDVGETFLAAYPPIVRKRMAASFTDEERHAQLRYRGLYAEFNLVHDRGTLFGLKTGGNIDAILMSLPPVVEWA